MRKACLVTLIWIVTFSLIMLFATFVPLPWLAFVGIFGFASGSVGALLTILVVTSDPHQRKPSVAARRRAWLKRGT